VNLYFLFAYIEHNGDESPKEVNTGRFKKNDPNSNNYI